MDDIRIIARTLLLALALPAFAEAAAPRRQRYQ